MLVDTNVVSELMRRRPDARVLAWAERQRSMSLSVITVEEILFGLACRDGLRLAAWFEQFLDDHCDVIPVSAEIARRSAELRAHLRTGGAARTQADMLIAATAREHGLPLATRNVRDFSGCGIAVVNPFDR